MALLKHSKHRSSFPTAKDTGLGEATTKEANAAVQRVHTEQPLRTVGRRKRKLKPRLAMSREPLLAATLQNTATLPLLRSLKETLNVT